MKRVLSFLCAVTMVLTMCTFYMGETLSVVAAETPADSNIIDIDSYAKLIAEMNKAANVGKTLRFTNDIEASDWTFDPVDKENLTVTAYKGKGENKQSIVISIAEETIGTVLSGAIDGVTVTNGVLQNFNTGYANKLYNGVNIDGNGFALKGIFVHHANKSDQVQFIDDISEKSTVKNIRIEDSAIIVKGTCPSAVMLANNVYGKAINCSTAEDVTIAMRRTATSVHAKYSGLFGYVRTKGNDPGDKNKNLEDLYKLLQGTLEGVGVTSVGVIDSCVNRTNIYIWQQNDLDTTAAGVVHSVNFTGGIVRNCSNHGDITIKGKASGIGGILGYVELGRNLNVMGYDRHLNVYNCANFGKIDTTYAQSKSLTNRAGGIFGYVTADWATGDEFNIVNCYNAGEITKGAANGIFGGYTTMYCGVYLNNDAYRYGSSLYGGTGLNFIKGNASPYMLVGTDGEKKITYKLDLRTENNGALVLSNIPNGLGNFSTTSIYKAPGNVSATKFFGTNDVTTILNTAAKYIEGAKPWKINETTGNPEIDITKEYTPAVITTKEELQELKAVHDALNNVGSQIVIKAILGDDINLNPDFTFGYDQEKQAAIVETGETTYYVGYGATTGALPSGNQGKFYTYNVETSEYVQATAPSLYSWTPFSSLSLKVNSTETKALATHKVTLDLDGAGHTIKGLYVYANGGHAGFAAAVNDVKFSNLTIDGLILNYGGGTAGAFISCTENDTVLENCVNNATVLQNSNGKTTNTGGLVGVMGINRGSEYLLDRFPDRISYIIGCTNNGAVAIAADYVAGNAYPCIGGVVGHVYNGEVSYSTNTGFVGTDFKAYAISGVVGLLETGTNINTVANAKAATAEEAIIESFGADTTGWATYTYYEDEDEWKYKGTNVAKPLQTIVRIVANSNSGYIYCGDTTQKHIASVIQDDCGWTSDGIWASTIIDDLPTLVLPSEIVIRYNIGQSNGNLTYSSAYLRRSSLGGSGLVWKDGEGKTLLSLSTSARFAETTTTNPNIEKTDATVANRNTNLAMVYPATQSYDRGYMMWIDYDYSNGSIPHAIKASAELYNGMALSMENNRLIIGIGNKDALMLLNDTVNYLPTRDAVVNSVEVDDIYDVYDIGATADEDKANVTAYLEEGRNGGVDVGQLQNATIKLTANIDLGGAQWRPLADDVPYFNIVAGSGKDAVMGYMAPVYSLKAIFDGQGYTISNFTFPRDSGVAFIGAINSGGSSSFINLQNVKFANVNIESNGKFVAIAVCHTYNVNLYDIVVEENCSVFAKEGCVAAIVCQQQGEVARCKNYADISSEGEFVGGIAVKNFWHTIYDNVNYGRVSTTTTGSHVGGVSAYAHNYWNDFSRNKNYGEIYAPNASKVGGVFGTYAASAAMNHTGFENHGNVTGGVSVGGVIGYDGSNNENDKFKNFVNTGAVTGVQKVGGIIGASSNPYITGALNSGTVTGKDNAADNFEVQVGGIVGSISSGTIVNSTNEGTVIGNDLYVGGIAGVVNSALIDACENRGNVTSLQYVGGIAGNVINGSAKITNSRNSGTVLGIGNPKAYNAAQAGGIAGRTAGGATVQGCENTGTVTTDSAETTHKYSAGIVASAAGTSYIIQNVNRGTVDVKNAQRAAGIIAAIDGANTVVRGNVNYGEVKGKDYLAGIIVWVSNRAVIKGNVNYGAISPTPFSGAIIGQMNHSYVEVCYNVNLSDSNTKLGSLGQYIVDNGANNTAPKVYGNIDAKGLGFLSSSKTHGFIANNYSLGRTSNATLIDGKAVTLDQFKFGEVADIINNLSYTSDMFLADSETYLYKDGSDEKIKPNGIAAGITSADLVAPKAFEENYMVQEIGVDPYPLPREAAEIIYADREMTAPVGKFDVAPAAPATEGTEKFVGYIDYDRNLYNVGDTIAGGAYLYPITVDFYTAYGAGARTSTPTGIRFQTLVKADSLDMMNGKLGAGNFGTIILPTSYVDAMMSDGEVDRFNKKLDVQQIITHGVKRVDIVNNGWASAEYGAIIKDGYYTYMGSLVNILEDNYAKAFTGISYLRVEYADREIAYITADWQTEKDGAAFVNGANYSKAANSREVRQIAFRALNDKTLDLSEAVRQTLEAYCGSYTE